MIRSFLTITLRILWRNKVTSFVNIFSLSVGITSFILIMLYIHHETSYDKFHENYSYIYRLEGDDYARLPPVIGDFLNERIPEIKNVVHVVNLSGVGKADISYRPDRNPENIKYAKADVVLADSTVFNIFTFSFLQGNPETALDNRFTAVITENKAHILFGAENPMGKTFEFGNHQFEVTGVIRNVKKSHLQIDALVSMTSLPYMFPNRDLNSTGGNAWLWSASYLFTNGEVDADRI
jgi:putative ABC transport system permease protein